MNMGLIMQKKLSTNLLKRKKYHNEKIIYTGLSENRTYD